MSGGRIRTIKPEILEDEKAAGLSPVEWRLWVSMWTLADDYGNLRGAPEWVHGQVFWKRPDVTVENVREALATLSRECLVTLYTVRGQQYASVANWARHQRVDKPGKPKVPGPECGETSEQDENSRDSRETSGDSPEVSRESRASRASTSPSISGSAPDPARDPLARLWNPPEQREDVQQVWIEWRREFDKPNAQLGHKRAEVIAECLDQPTAFEEIQAAFRGARLDDWVASKGFQVSLILGDRERFEHLVDLGTGKIKPPAKTRATTPTQPSHGKTGWENAQR